MDRKRFTPLSTDYNSGQQVRFGNCQLEIAAKELAHIAGKDNLPRKKLILYLQPLRLNSALLFETIYWKLMIIGGPLPVIPNESE